MDSEDGIPLEVLDSKGWEGNKREGKGREGRAGRKGEGKGGRRWEVHTRNSHHTIM